MATVSSVDPFSTTRISSSVPRAREREAAEPVDRRPVFDDSEIDVESRSAVLELDDSGIEGEARPEHDALAPACRAPREDDRERVRHRLLGIQGDSLAVAVALDA